MQFLTRAPMPMRRTTQLFRLLCCIAASRLRAFRARLLCEDGNPAAALTECELALQLAEPPLAVLADLLRAVLAADPGLARAHKLLGDVLGAAGDLQEALRAHGRALRWPMARWYR